MKPKTIELAKGRWLEILLNLGVDERYLSGRHSDCPICGQGKDTYRFDDKDGSGSYYCGYCKPGYGMDFVMKLFGLYFKDAANLVDEILGDVQPIQRKAEKDPRESLRRIAKGLAPLTGDDPVSVYLRNRGLSVASAEITCSQSLTYWDSDSGEPVNRGGFPAMVVPIRDKNGTALTYHITYIDQGQKAGVCSPKKVMTPISSIKGGAIRLFPAGKHIAVAEGIETALAFYEDFNIPVWVTVNAHMMENLVLPPEVERLTIVADSDKTFTGQKAAFTLAHRYALKGVYVDVKLPDVIGHDYLDVLNEQKGCCTMNVVL